MKRETFEAQKAFAEKKKPSMLRRCVGHDYTGRQIYMITMVTEGRRPLFGEVVGRSDAPMGSDEEPRIILTELGKRVADEWWATSVHHPEIEVVALQMMPDHLHGILFVKEKMKKPLGMALRGFKQSCNKHYRVALATRHMGVALATQHTEPALTTQHTEPGVGTRVALATQHTELRQTKRDRRGEDRNHGMLFARGYNDRLLLRKGQLDTWRHYLADNPRRLLMKREHPDMFRVQRNVEAAGITFSAIGNRLLLDYPDRLQVQCSRSLTERETKTKVAEYLTAAKGGAVLVSPAISPGEKAVMRAAFDEGLPLIYLQENGFTDLAKPGGKRMNACANGQLLILAPWEHHNERLAIRRGQCLELNEIARRICER
jgi:REP element-mobilizing transposase RayT